MKHEEAAPLLLDRLQGRPGAEADPELAAHVDACEDCRTLTETHQAIAGAFAGRDAPGAHLTSDEIVKVALDPAARQSFDPHLQLCARCAWEVENVRSAEKETASETLKPVVKAVEARSMAPNWMAIAASFIALALLYPAYIGTFRFPGVAEERRALAASSQESKTRIGQLESSLQQAQQGLDRLSWSGAVQVPVLSPPLRGREPRVAQVPIEPGQPFVALALDLTTADRLQGTGSYRLTVRSAEGAEAFAIDLPGAEIRNRIAVGGVLSLFVPASKLPRGSYTLKIEPAGASGPPLFESSFAVTAGLLAPVSR
jgi:hypothetical protein